MSSVVYSSPVDPRDPIDGRAQVQVQLLHDRSADVPMIRQVPLVVIDQKHHFCRRFPVFILVVTFCQILASVYYIGIMDNDLLAIVSSPFIFNPYCQLQLWRFLTYTLVHDGMSHITFNVVSQLLVGSCVEMVHGSAKTAAVYFLGSAIVVLSISNAEPYAFTMGASGAVFVLVSSLLLTALLTPLPTPPPFAFFRVICVCLCLAICLASVLQVEFLFEDAKFYTHLAHGNAMLTGVPLSIVFLGIFERWKGRERTVRTVTAALFTIFVVAMIIRSFYFYFSVLHPIEDPIVWWSQEQSNNSATASTAH